MKRLTGYLVGSVIVSVIAFVVIPPLIDAFSDKLYNQNVKPSPAKPDDDWGPEIVRKEELA